MGGYHHGDELAPDLSQRNQIPTEVNDKVQAEFLRRSLRCLLTARLQKTSLP